MRLGFAGVAEMARVRTDTVVGYITLIALLMIVDECCLLFRTLVPHPNRFGSLDRSHVRTDTTNTRTATHPGGDVDDDGGGCIDIDRNWAGLCVLQCVSVVASALKRAALSNSD